MTQVVLVDAHDVAVVAMEKLTAHQAAGHLHRAISVFVFDNAGNVLRQQRADDKHLFRLLWANTACSHPQSGEEREAAGRRRLRGDGHRRSRGRVGTFTYLAEDAASGLVDHELDHVLIGHSNLDPPPDPTEVADWRRLSVAELRRQLTDDGTLFAPWLALALGCCCSDEVITHRPRGSQQCKRSVETLRA